MRCTGSAVRMSRDTSEYSTPCVSFNAACLSARLISHPPNAQHHPAASFCGVGWVHFGHHARLCGPTVEEYDERRLAPQPVLLGCNDSPPRDRSGMEWC